MSTLQATNLKHASSASNNLALDTNGNVTAAGTIAMATPFAMRNRIINGGMDIWQRGTSFSSPAGGAYLADRYFTFFTSITSFSRSTDAPTGFRYSAELVGTDVSVYQKIEDVNCDNLAGGTVTFSFWAKNVSGTGGLSVVLLSPTAPNNYASFTTIYNASVSASPSGSWTRYTVTANVDANIVNGLQCQIARSGAATTRVTGLQLEVGSVATPFERRSYSLELQLCQRYLPAWTSGGNNVALGNGQSYASTNAIVGLNYPVTPRVPPTGLSLFGSYLILNGGAAGISVSAITINSASTSLLQLNVAVASGLTAGQATMLLATSPTTNIIATGCEL